MDVKFKALTVRETFERLKVPPGEDATWEEPKSPSALQVKFCWSFIMLGQRFKAWWLPPEITPQTLIEQMRLPEVPVEHCGCTWFAYLMRDGHFVLSENQGIR